VKDNVVLKQQRNNSVFQPTKNSNGRPIRRVRKLLGQAGWMTEFSQEQTKCPVDEFIPLHMFGVSSAGAQSQ
jgi:hypothetical protein